MNEGVATGGDTLPVCYRHPGRETGVRCSRCDRPICPDCMVVASVGFHCPECVAEGRRTTRSARTVYGGKVGAHGQVTRLLIAANVAVFLITSLSSGSLFATVGPIYTRFALVPYAVAHGDYYRLLSSTFLHYGPMHIAFNMWALWVVGPPLEAALGRLRFSVLYVLSGIGGGALSVLLGPLLLQAAGASGAIFGLFGAFFVVARHRGRDTGGIVGLIGINLVITFLVPNIDWRGHVGGLVTGALVAAALAYAPAGRSRQTAQAVGVGIVALLVLGVVVVGVHQIDHVTRAFVTPQ